MTHWPAERSTMPLLISPSDTWDAESLGQRLVKGVEQLFEQEGWALSDDLRSVRLSADPEPCDPYAVRLLDFLGDCLIVAERSGGPPAEQQALFEAEPIAPRTGPFP